MWIKLDCFIKFFLKGNYIWNEKNVAGESSKIWLTGLATGNMAWGGGEALYARDWQITKTSLVQGNKVSAMSLLSTK